MTEYKLCSKYSFFVFLDQLDYVTLPRLGNCRSYYSKVLWTIDIRVMNEEISSYKQGCLSFLVLLWCQINAGNFYRSSECKCMLPITIPLYHSAQFPFWFGAMHFVHTVCFNLRYRLRRLVSTKLLQLSFLWSQTAIKKERVHQGKNFAFFCQNLKLNMKFFLFKRSGHAFLQFCNCWHFFGKFYYNEKGQDLRKTQAKN